jgi:hypothetical protein
VLSLASTTMFSYKDVRVLILSLLLVSTALERISSKQEAGKRHRITEDLSDGATLKFKIAPDQPEFTFKVIPEVQSPDPSGNPQSTIQDVQVFRGTSKESSQSLARGV